MLEDFVDDLKKIIAERRELDRDLLETGPQSTDLTRGRIQAFKQALIDIDELALRYAAPESVPDGLQDYSMAVAVTKGSRFGNRRSAA